MLLVRSGIQKICNSLPIFSVKRITLEIAKCCWRQEMERIVNEYHEIIINIEPNI